MKRSSQSGERNRSDAGIGSSSGGWQAGSAAPPVMTIAAATPGKQSQQLKSVTSMLWLSLCNHEKQEKEQKNLLQGLFRVSPHRFASSLLFPKPAAVFFVLIVK